MSAIGTDSETGIRRVVLHGQPTIVCIPQTGTNLVRIANPIYVEYAAQTTSLPITQQIFYTLDVSAERARCPAATRFYDLNTELTVTCPHDLDHVE